MSRGQIESFGLVIIVILIVFVGIFALVLSQGGDDDKHTFLSAKAYNFANAIYRSDIGGSSFRELTSSCCLDGSSCDEIENFVNANMNLIDEDVGFVMKCINDFSISTGDCFLGVKSESFYVSDAELYVFICEK